ncbi:NAD-binding protein [Streptomyces sp. SID8361]|uniref:NAD(P)-dependent oxidoreductase n=1 Tax=Streptomyces sp. MnatMP-M27 TaxID=1839768 RepID=UPI00081EEB71|nr:NAD(P)-dependent oxidoreductase [Streptomyces sp. MnatMP-M27]MYU12633.1 NAD-binding protein [Streptomyces sp. SID8361]SCF93570.1 3-hydroxyisobutyrate dehydrogenase [Streptomyces sp. MnatMP-M27]
MARTRQSAEPHHVCVLGGGIMARAVIARLHDRGHRLRLYNRSPERLAAFADSGVKLCATPAEAARDVEAVLSFVSDDTASAAVWYGPAGALAALRPGALTVECSTLSVTHTEDWSRACLERGGRPVDLALTGSLPRAIQGTLIGFAGATAENLSRLQPLADSFTECIVHFGESGAGMRYKLVHNLAAAATLVGLAEALNLAEFLELDMSQTISTLSAYGWAAPVAQSKAWDMARASHADVMCSLDNLAKDVGYALAATRRGGTELPLARTLSVAFSEAAALGGGPLDMAAVKLAYLSQRPQTHDPREDDR